MNLLSRIKQRGAASRVLAATTIGASACFLGGCDAVNRVREKNKVKPIVDFSKRGDVSRFQWKSQPKTLQANRRALWSLKVLWRKKPDNGREYIRDFTFIDEHILHLYVVSQDRKFFAHLLPEPRDYGHFLVETALPRAGKYQLLAEYVPHDSLPELKRTTIVVAPSENGVELPLPAAPPLLSDSRKSVDSAATVTALDIAGNPQLSGDGAAIAPPASAQTIRLELVSGFTAGEEATFHATPIAKNADGTPMEIESYLGGAGFFCALSEDGKTFVRGVAETPQVSAPPSGSEYSRSAQHAGTRFMTRFPRAGKYTLWCQFGLERARLHAPFEIVVGAAQNAKQTQPSSLQNRPTATR